MGRACAVAALTVLSPSSLWAQEGAAARASETTIHASNSQSARIPADMAAPVVSGVAVLLLACYPELCGAQVEQILPTLG